MRVYRKDQLIRRDHEALHMNGLWYAEPTTWTEAAPAQRGYPSLHEALSEAQMIEDRELQAQLVGLQATRNRWQCRSSEPEARRWLLVRFDEAVRRYREDVSRLYAAAGSLEYDAFQKLLEKCNRSRSICAELLGELSGRE
jgi:hypothetical protein